MILKWFKYLLRRVRKEKIKAVYEDDLISLLSSLGILEKIRNGELKCEKCCSIISIENIGLIKKVDRRLIILCDDSNCL